MDVGSNTDKFFSIFLIVKLHVLIEFFLILVPASQSILHIFEIIYVFIKVNRKDFFINLIFFCIED